jgi:DNA-binding NarL/FixJ family response regulator
MMKNSPPITLLLVDDHALIREAFSSLLGGDDGTSGGRFRIIGQASNGREAVRMALQHRPDLILMDVLMPILDGGDAAREIRQRLPAIRILMVSSVETARSVTLARDSGADGYVFKSEDRTALLAAIEKVMTGHTIFPDRLADGDDQSVLTRRERQVLKLMIEGWKNREIAEALFITARTVEKHRANVIRKVGSAKPADLVHFAEQSLL